MKIPTDRFVQIAVATSPDPTQFPLLYALDENGSVYYHNFEHGVWVPISRDRGTITNDARRVDATVDLLECAKAAHLMIARFIEDYETRKPSPSINYDDAKMLDFSLTQAIKKAKGE